MTIQIATRGPKIGACNICGATGPLTEDHTPPKGCVRPSQVMLRHISYHLAAGPEVKGRMSQNGVKYRTLCARCNNLLGARYDPALISFANTTAQVLTTALDLPDIVDVQVQPQAILRSVLGHLAAQGVDRYLKGPNTEGIRDFILDPALSLPSGLYAYCWVYPSRPFVLVRDAAFVDLTHGNPITIWLTKFFPMAFLITVDGPMTTDQPIHNLEAWRSLPFLSVLEFPLRIRPQVHPYWPEAPTPTTIVVYGQEAVTASLHSRGGHPDR